MHLSVYPPGFSRRAEPAACFTQGGCTHLSLDGFELFPRVPLGASRVSAFVLNPGAPQFSVSRIDCCVTSGVYGMSSPSFIHFPIQWSILDVLAFIHSFSHSGQVNLRSRLVLHSS